MVKPALRPHVAPAPLEPVVVKLGGRALESPAALTAFTTELAAVRGPLVLVHGGGAEVNEWLERLGIAPRFEHGLRVNDAATLDVVAAVLAGLANKRLVAALRTAGVDAVGLSVLDGGSLACERHPQTDSLGEVGVPVGGDAALLASLLAQGRVPVLASLGMSDSGALLNVNAEDAAAALATLLALSGNLPVRRSTFRPGFRVAGMLGDPTQAARFRGGIYNSRASAVGAGFPFLFSGVARFVLRRAGRRPGQHANIDVAACQQ